MERNWAIYLARRLWDFHPGVRSQNELTMGERAADRLRNGMGSWAFVFVALLFLATWMAFNRNTGFDPYPFILLNLLLSCVAALQGAVLLIAARRADQISAELALHDYNTDNEALELIRKLEEITKDIQIRVGGGEPPEGSALNG